jgi:hypothetical protein
MKPRVVALLGLGLGLTLAAWSIGSATTVNAQTPNPGLNYSIEAVDQDNCDTTEGDAVCYIEPGSDFELTVTLDPLPDDIEGYDGFEIYLSYTGLTSSDDADASAHWPDCGFPATNFDPGLVAAACSVGIDPGTPSTYTGIMLSNTFTCSESGTISLEHGAGKTILLETLEEQHNEGNAMETLNITCGDEPTPTNTPAPETPAMPTALPGTGFAGSEENQGAGIWMAIAALVTFAVVGLSAFAWRTMRAAR